MKLLRISEHHFVNPSQIVELKYTPAEIKNVKKRTKDGWRDTKVTLAEIASSIKITLSVGSPHSFSGAEADRIYNELLEVGKGGGQGS